MDEIPPIFEASTIEQVRVLADDLRVRILQALVDQPMTVTQLGDLLRLAPAKIHYHVRELQRVGLLRLVAVREKGGILEKYYRAVARDISVPSSLISSAPTDELVRICFEFVGNLRDSFIRAITRQEGQDRRSASLGLSHLWLTDEEMEQVTAGISDALEEYTAPRGVEGERERTLAFLWYDTELGAEPDDVPDEPIDPSGPHGIGGSFELKRGRTFAGGAFTWTRSDLEKALERGETLDLTILGLATFTDDVTPELIDRAVYRFRHRGKLRASPEVRRALKRKEQAPSSE
jgi:DNA-binding transcriptional ArsR family regulator